jgi:hypothetical protein
MTASKHTILSLVTLVVLLSLTCVLALTTLRPKVRSAVPQWLHPKTDTIRDTIRLRRPGIVRTIQVPVPAGKVDSAAGVAAYYAKNVYHDTLVDSPQLTIHLTDTVQNNRLMGRTVDYRVKTVDRCHRLFLSSAVSLSSASVFAGYGSRRWSVFGGYDFMNRTPVVGASYNLLRW